MPPGCSGLHRCVRSTGLWCNPTAPDLTPMGIHPNARLTPIGRERLIRQHLDEDTSLAQLAAGHVSANAPPASGWRAFVQAGQRHWRIVAACAAQSGGRSIRSNCSRPWTSGTSVAPSGESPGCCWCRSAAWPGRCPTPGQGGLMDFVWTAKPSLPITNHHSNDSAQTA